jgi:heptosyltransferase-2
VGRSSLREFFALASQCDALVSNDSGAMHVGYAVGVPVVAVFGSTDPALTGPPPGAAARIIRRELHCSPCFERHCPEGHLRCLEDISPREVLQALKELLPSRRAVFLDRDGTLCQDPGYLSRWEDFRPLPGLQELRRLKEAGFLLVGITNQSGIARGLVREEFVQEVNAYFLREHGFDAFYYCPHHPREHCSCRKPSPGMLLRARAELGVDLRRSWLVGDKELDLEAAQAVGARAVKVGAPMGLKEAVEFILKEELKDANSPGD